MNKCPSCSVNVYQNHCPLCGRSVEQSAMSQIKYPPYAVITTREVIVRKILWFITISSILISLFINIFTYSAYEKLWALIVCVSLVFVTSTIFILRSKKINVGGKIIRLFTTTSALLVTIDAVNGFDKWSTTYAIPFLTVAVALLFTIITSTRKNKFNEYFGYLLAIAFISVAPIALYLFGLTNQLWSSLIATLACIIIALGLYIFSEQSLKDELKKRFHT